MKGVPTKTELRKPKYKLMNDNLIEGVIIMIVIMKMMRVIKMVKATTMVTTMLMIVKKQKTIRTVANLG